MKYDRAYAESLWYLISIISMIVTAFWILAGDIILMKLKEQAIAKDLFTFVVTVVMVTIVSRWILFHTGMMEEEEDAEI